MKFQIGDWVQSTIKVGREYVEGAVGQIVFDYRNVADKDYNQPYLVDFAWSKVTGHYGERGAGGYAINHTKTHWWCDEERLVRHRGPEANHISKKEEAYALQKRG